MKKRILCSLIMLVSLGFTKIGAEEDFITKGGLQKQNVEVKAKVPVKYLIEIPKELNLGSFNKTDDSSETSIFKEFKINLREVEIEYGKSIFISLEGSNFSMIDDRGGSLDFGSNLIEKALEFKHSEFNGENDKSNDFSITVDKNSMTSAGDFVGSVNFVVSYEDSIE